MRLYLTRCGSPPSGKNTGHVATKGPAQKIPVMKTGIFVFRSVRLVEHVAAGDFPLPVGFFQHPQFAEVVRGGFLAGFIGDRAGRGGADEGVLADHVHFQHGEIKIKAGAAEQALVVVFHAGFTGGGGVDRRHDHAVGSEQGGGLLRRLGFQRSSVVGQQGVDGLHIIGRSNEAEMRRILGV